MALLLPIPALNSSSAIRGLRVPPCPGASFCCGVGLGRRGLVCWVPNAVYTAQTHTHTQSTEQQWKPKSGKREDSAEGDAITILNERIRREQSKREGSGMRTVMESEEADKYIEMVKQQQQRGLEKLRGDAGYKVDPYTLRSGDYVVHKKVGIGRFVGIKLDSASPSFNSASKTDSIEYVFIEYADGMAKLPVKQASRLLYRYNLPNETKRPRTLSKLSDTSVWEKRKTKGKIAIQKMVVDLMELYLHRLKQRRPPYPLTPAMTHFVSQFPYQPTPDQQQAFIDVHKDLTARETPMDHLICGDVGFGKTEVALRAIFCVVSAGNQAMVLAPTIVLAKQHFDVISDRFSIYPDIKVGLLSRFQYEVTKLTTFPVVLSFFRRFRQRFPSDQSRKGWAFGHD